MPKLIPNLLIGSKYGDWTILEERPRPREMYYLCRCVCGTEREVSKYCLRNGVSKNCNLGSCKPISSSITHGMSESRMYQTWLSMRQRIKNPIGANSCYAGLTICPEWDDFAVFHKWATSNGYADNLTIDRIKTDVGYTPDNCRWVDTVVQSQNRRKHNTSKQEPKGVYKKKPRNGKVLYSGTHKAPYFWIVIYKGTRHQKSGFVTAEEAYKDRCAFIKKHYDGLVYPD